MFHIQPLGSSSNSPLFGIFKKPVVVVQRKDGRQVELTRDQLKELGQDPNQDDDRNIIEKIRDFFVDFWDYLKTN